MEKKSAIKNNSVKKSVNSNLSKPSLKRPASKILGKENKVEKILVENFISLQKVMINMTDKFSKLGTQIEQLLNLFEGSAKALAKKEFDLSKEEKDHKKILDQIDNLLEQNKTIARSLSLMHEVTHGEEIEPEPNLPPMQMPSQQPKPPMPAPNLPPAQQPMLQTSTAPTQSFPPMQPQSPPPQEKGVPPAQEISPEQGSAPLRMEDYQKSISSPPEQNILQKPPMTKPNEVSGGEGNAR